MNKVIMRKESNMKKSMKKLCTLMLAFSLMVLSIPFKAYAAEGSLQFSDPTCAAGEKVDINVRVISAAENVGSYEVKIKYDPAMLKFESGDNATGSNGSITLTYDGGSVLDTLHVLNFTALDNGSTTLSVSSYNAKVESGADLDLALGESVVTIEGGTPVEASEEPGSDNEAAVTAGSDASLDVKYKDIVYHIAEDFPEKEIPTGFEKVSAEYNGITVSAFSNSNTGCIVFYGTDDNGETAFLYQDEQTKEIHPAVAVPVNNSLSIMVMDHPEGDKMPEHIMPTTMTLNGKVFTIWNNTDNQDFYYIYALSSNGYVGYYEYDATEQTYQRANKLEFEIEEEVVEEKPALVDFFENNLILIASIIGIIILILVIVIIILSVLLSKRGRNKEYGENYDEEITDDVNDYDENDVYEVDFDDYDDSDVSAEEMDEAMNDYFEDLEFDTDDEEVFDNLEASEPKPSKKRRTVKKSKDDDDDFSIDFIEL